jgi:hypothetical protein
MSKGIATSIGTGKYEQLLEICSRLEPIVTAVVHPCEAAALLGAIEAAEKGLSGGEPLMQDRFAVKLLSAARAMGIHTALDTNGSLSERLSDAELEQIDLVLLDIKSWDSERHQKLTEMDVTPVLEFAQRLAACKRPSGCVSYWSQDSQTTRIIFLKSQGSLPPLAMSSESTFCPFIKWVALSGKNSNSTMPSITFDLRHRRLLQLPARDFGRRV